MALHLHRRKRKRQSSKEEKREGKMKKVWRRERWSQALSHLFTPPPKPLGLSTSSASSGSLPPQLTQVCWPHQKSKMPFSILPIQPGLILCEVFPEDWKLLSTYNCLWCSPRVSNLPSTNPHFWNKFCPATFKYPLKMKRTDYTTNRYKVYFWKSIKCSQAIVCTHLRSPLVLSLLPMSKLEQTRNK